MTIVSHARKLLNRIRTACETYDVFIPHGSVEWRALRWLLEYGYIKSAGFAACCDCNSSKHCQEETAVEGFVLTEKGVAAEAFIQDNYQSMSEEDMGLDIHEEQV